MSALRGSKTHENLKHAFALESQANRRYLYFARAADIEGHPDIGGLFRDTSEAETGHAFGHMDFLKAVGDPATDVAFGNTRQNLQSAVEGETYEYTQMYPGMARTAREEGIPYLGICLGMQLAVIECARNMAGLNDANSTEFDAATPHPSQRTALAR